VTKRTRRPADELPFVSTRIAAATYAEQPLAGLVSAIYPVNLRRQGYIRDELLEAFEAGEHQGIIRAIVVLGIARRWKRASGC
jgi:hypothetical protein